MSRYGSHTSEHYVEVVTGDSASEVGFSLTMNCSSLGTPAQLCGRPEDCYEAEAAEFELDSIHLIAVDGNHYLITDEIFSAMVGPEIEESMIEAARAEADESGDF